MTTGLLSPSGTRRPFLKSYGFLCLVIAAAMTFTLVRQVIGHSGYLVDLQAFYCGGWSVLHHADPYTSTSTTCVDSIEPGAAALRAPHPPFALVFYALLALFPFKAVGIAYIVLAWLAVGATAIVLSKLTGIESWIVALAIAPLLGYFCISFGQPQPFVALCIVLCAYFLATQRFAAAAICAALTLVFPQFGIPLVAAVFVCAPPARMVLAGAVGVLVLVGVVVLGLPANVHWVTVSLKLEQLQTAGDALQYGLPWLLQQLGVPSVSAALVGSVWYVAVFLAGLFYLHRSAKGTMVVLVALLPPALVTLSSTFVHPQHFALALPFALFALSTGTRRRELLVGTALLVVPWAYCIIALAVSHDALRVAIFFALGLAFAACFLRSRGASDRSPLFAIAGLYVLIAIVIHAVLGRIVSVDDPSNTLATLSFKLPTIIGLLIVLFFGLTTRAQRIHRSV